MATRNPALFMDATDKYGSVTPGKIADLVLLDADPLNDIHNTTTISEVFLSGKEYERERFRISAFYYTFVTEELEKANQTYELWARTYPRDEAPHLYLGLSYAWVGHTRMLSQKPWKTSA
jgi:adenine deaminase